MTHDKHYIKITISGDEESVRTETDGNINRSLITAALGHIEILKFNLLKMLKDIENNES